ncbi:MAG: MBOAT family O-acyltransferase [Dokdonia sp.]|jgi:D-alanyl-lipoteichoic acid acyltransferase DltB (MBOAT superfamily)
MLFNSVDFAFFLPIVFVLYWFVFNQRLRWQNAFVVLASYVFYGWWDWRFLLLIFTSTAVDYLIGKKLTQSHQKKSRLLWLSFSILVNLGMLGFFKYYNFFLQSFVDAFSLFGHDLESKTLAIILPVGISFYTFQTMSYTIDVYRKKMAPTQDFIAFAAFVSFFPQLVAGPIERASHLLPQFFKERKLNYTQAVDGSRQILWGLFKKMVIADNCAPYVNYIFDNSDQLNGSTLLIGAVLFSFQIYGDFSGYSDIAIGTARLFGFDLRQNFATPYFSRDIAEFWRRWHISLSTWFRDYLYIPLGGSRVTKVKVIRNVCIVFLVSGFWHGANWTFIVWGGIHALLFLPLLVSGKNRVNLDPSIRSKGSNALRQWLSISGTFLLVTLAWIFFRADTLTAAIVYIQEIFSSSLLSIPVYEGMKSSLLIGGLILFLLIIEWRARSQKHALGQLELRWPKTSRYILYYILVFLIYWFGGKDQPFIYFQF